MTSTMTQNRPSWAGEPLLSSKPSSSGDFDFSGSKAEGYLLPVNNPSTESLSAIPGCPPYYCRCMADEPPAGTLGSPGVQNSSPAQCSRGIHQSRPFPARSLKMMVSAGHNEDNTRGAAPQELAYRSPVTGSAGCRTLYANPSGVHQQRQSATGTKCVTARLESHIQHQKGRFPVGFSPSVKTGYEPVEDSRPVVHPILFSLSVGFHTPTARLLSTARGQTTPGIPFSFAVKLSCLARRAERFGDAAETRELLPSPQSGVSPARRTSFAAELPDEGGIWFSPFRLLSTVLARLDARCGPHMAKRELALARRGSNTTMTQRCAAKVALVVSATGKGCRVGNPAWTVGPVVRHIEGTGHGLTSFITIRSPRQCLPGRGLDLLSQRPDAQPFLPPGHQQSPAGSVRTPTTGGNL